MEDEFESSLIWASSHGHLPLAELLICANADVNAKNVKIIAVSMNMSTEYCFNFTETAHTCLLVFIN